MCVEVKRGQFPHHFHRQGVGQAKVKGARVLELFPRRKREKVGESPGGLRKPNNGRSHSSVKRDFFFFCWVRMGPEIGRFIGSECVTFCIFFSLVDKNDKVILIVLKLYCKLSCSTIYIDDLQISVL